MNASVALRAVDALLLVDVQNDFLPGGALPVAAGGRVVAAANAWLERFRLQGLPVYASRDWHPQNHCSFQAQGGPWPPHCVAGTTGADFPDDLRLPDHVVVVDKAKASDRDAYSAFEGTELDRLFKAKGVARLFIGGLATDYCVLRTVLDALRLDYAVFVLTDAIAAVNVRPGDEAKALAAMCEAGAVAITIHDLVG
jgi:nicotinamidase/pyrazinamidase